MSATENETATELAVPAPSEAQAIVTVAQILNAPSDLVEQTIEVPEWGGHIRIRSLTAAEQAKVRQASIELGADSPRVIFAEMEKRQFEYGVVEPKFTKEDVNVLFHKSSTSWRRVINALDALTGTRKDLAEAEAAFPAGGGESTD